MSLINQRSFIPMCVSTLRLIFHSWKCDVYQFPFHLLLCFHFLVLNNFSNFLLVSIPTMIDQSNESNLVDSHHLLFRAWLSRFGIGKEVYYTKCLTEGHPCLVAFDYGSENNVVSQRLVEKLQLPTSFHPNQARIKFSTGQCVKEVLCDIAPTNSCHLLLRWAWLHFKTLNLDERSLYLRHEGHEMKLKFMTPRQAKKDQHTLKEKIEKERIEKEEI